MQRARLAVICDYAEEVWPSMDQVGEMLCAELTARHSNALEVTRIRPAFIRRLSRAGAERCAPERFNRIRFNADRALNRFFDYPRALRRLIGSFDIFHIVDHSYAHLAHELDGSRTIVTCHDLDAFRLLIPGADRRSLPLRMMARRTLAGMRKAAHVCCDSMATRDALVANAMVLPERLLVIPNGVHPACSPRPDEAADAAAASLLGPAGSGMIEVLHVGSTIGRKRIDVLLRVLSAARAQLPNLRLIKAGGALTADQQRLAQALGLAQESVVTMPFLEPAVLAALYRRAAVVLMPSEAEGFGLPLVEAMACATPVIASDIPALREVGAEAAVYCAVADVPAWSTALCAMLREREGDPMRWAARRTAAIRQAARFSWTVYADRCAELYRKIADELAV